MTLDEKRERNRVKNIKWRQENKEKYLMAAFRYRKFHHERIRNYKLKIKYGLSIEEYNKLYQCQNGKCAICGNIESVRHSYSKEIISLAVDHCHKSGRVRGLLCQECNRGIGKFHDDILRLENAIKYLTSHYDNK